MKYTTTLLLGAIIATASLTAYASPGEGRMEKRIQHMTENLELNEQQQEQMREIMKSHMQQRKAMKEKKIEKIKSILTPAQQEKFEKLRAERKARRQEFRKNCKRNKNKPAS